MKRIACIHTVYSVIESFTQQLRDGIPGDILIHTLYDDFLATDPAMTGKFSAINHQRLRLDMQAQARGGHHRGVLLHPVPLGAPTAGGVQRPRGGH